MLKFSHIINPVLVNKQSDLFFAQPITFETLYRAKNSAKKDFEVQLFTAQFSEDKEIIPEFFSQTYDLNRSVLNFGEFNKHRKLPLIKDILDRLVEAAPNADYIIYTNVDIALQLHFYSFVERKIKEGYDAFVINRRTISDKYSNVEELPLMYSEYGTDHPGYDCFVFKKELYKDIELGNICIGAAFVGLALYVNLRLLSNRFKEFNNEHLTFHIGNDKVWKKPENNEYNIHNKNEFDKVKQILSSKFSNVEEIINQAFPILKLRSKKCKRCSFQDLLKKIKKLKERLLLRMN